MDEEDVDSMYMQQNVTQPLKKNEIIPFATIWTDLENSIDCIVHGVAKSWIQLSDFLFTSLWASLVPQLVKNPFEMWETWV